MSLSPLTPGSLLQRVRPAREPGWRVQGATPGPAPAPRAGSSPRHPRPPAGHTGRRHRQVIVGVRKGNANTEASRGPASGAGAMSLPGAGAVANETNANRGRREERHDSCPAPSGPRAPQQAGSSSGRCEAEGQTCGCRGVDARRLRLPSRGLRGNRSGAEGVITGSESEGGRQTMCFGSSRVFKSNGICWIPVPFSPSFEQADMCPIHTPLRHPGDLAGRCRRFLLDWDKDDAGRSPANKTRPPARADADPGTAAKSARATAELRGPRAAATAPLRTAPPPPV